METDSESSSGSEDSDDAPNGVPHVVKRRGPGTLPANPYGMVFLRNLRIGPNHPVPRFDETGGFNELTKSAHNYFFRHPDFEAIRDLLLGESIAAPVNTDRVRNKARNIAPYHIHGQSPQKPLFKLKAQGARIAPRPHDQGSDIEVDRDDENDETDIDKIATDIWHMFNLDITQVSPNYKGAKNSPYTRLTKAEREMVNEDTYKNPKLSDYFYDCQWMYASYEEWDKCFDTLFPDKSQPPRNSKSQNYFKTRYFPKWEDLKGRMDPQSHEQMRKALRRRFETLYWMPAAVKERIWWTKLDERMVKSSGIDRKNPSPRILINSGPSYPPQW
ncbi:hypothetical protein BDZ94DRAFT_1277938 [Collybia nuda]|uniref:Uncharacterized protein n=1 Tax=Collybia nuda TaxID=64659 RepID=A0A9P5XRS0_9AGAR|nr:hypothetical protein BDZ94DRAFT_1277938 [Collybia nuda]